MKYDLSETEPFQDPENEGKRILRSICVRLTEENGTNSAIDLLQRNWPDYKAIRICEALYNLVVYS